MAETQWRLRGCEQARQTVRTAVGEHHAVTDHNNMADAAAVEILIEGRQLRLGTPIGCNWRTRRRSSASCGC